MQVQKQWCKFISNDTDNVIHSITADRDGSLYLIGYTRVIVDGLFIAHTLLRKLSSSGAELWRRQLQEYDAFSVHIALDTQGNIYFSGKTIRGGELSLFKFSPHGVELWRRRIGGHRMFATNLSLDAAGNIYVAGTSWIQYYDNGPAWLMKLTPDGTELWQRQRIVEMLPFKYFAACTVVVDWEGNAYISSMVEIRKEGLEPIVDVLIVKISTNGTELWRRQFSPSRSEHLTLRDTATGSGVDEAGNFYFYICSEGVLRLIKMTPDGIELWSQQTERRSRHNAALTVDSFGNVYLADIRYSSNFICLTKFSSNGTELWNHQFELEGQISLDASTYSFSGPNSAITLDGGGNIYLFGARDSFIDFFSDTPRPGQWLAKFYNIPETHEDADELNRLRFQTLSSKYVP